jgi:transposase-like protein
MSIKNPYRKRAKIWVKKTREIIKLFSLDIPASKVARIVNLSNNTIEDRFDYYREAIYQYTEDERIKLFNWQIEIDESYFWPTRIRGKRGRWAGMKTIVFGLLKRNWRVYTEIVPDVKAKTLQKIIRGKVGNDSELNTDGWHSYDGLVDLWYEKHYRVHHGENEFARGNQHINWIESFRSFTKRRLRKFNGISKHKFPLYLKESEFRFNCWLQHLDMYKQLLSILKSYSRFLG